MKIQKLIIGRREYIDLPELGLYQIEAKIDTGAYTSALHCQKVRILDSGELKMATFQLLDASHPGFKEQILTFPVHKTKRIKSSNGQIQTRYIIKTDLKIGGITRKIEFSLADRSRMEYPILIGRKALRGYFIVDVSKTHLLDNQ